MIMMISSALNVEDEGLEPGEGNGCFGAWAKCGEIQKC